MIKVDIPGRGKYEIENAVFDYNGTVAVNGDMSENTQKNLKKLSEYVNIYILTADTYGTVKKNVKIFLYRLKYFQLMMQQTTKKNSKISFRAEYMLWKWIQ